jgi:thiamine biosynthesis protein ThiS
MQLTVKLVGTLGKYLPENSENNVTEINSEDNLTVVQLIQKLGLPADKPYIISVNDEVLARADRQTHFLQDTDNVKIIPPLKGG